MILQFDADTKNLFDEYRHLTKILNAHNLKFSHAVVDFIVIRKP